MPATPATIVPPVSSAPAGPLSIATVTLPVNTVCRFPYWSRARTALAGSSAPAIAAAGCVNIVSCVVMSPNTFAAKTVGELIRPATRAVNCTVPVVVGRVGWYDERPRLSVGTVAVPSVSTPPRTITQPTDTPAMGFTNASSMRTSTGAGRS